MKNNLNVNVDKNFDWELIQKELRHQFGNEIFESWLKKIVFKEKFPNYILVSVSTRFIRDWIVSRYLDQILSIIKKFNKEIIRVEFKIENKDKKKALAYLPKLNSELMKIAKTGIVKKGNASRNISRITRKISAL